LEKLALYTKIELLINLLYSVKHPNIPAMKYRPALQLAIITFSAYFILINTLIEDSNSDLYKYFNYSIIADWENNNNKNDLIDFLL